MSKVLVLFAEGFEEIEAISVVDILRRAEIDTVTCSVGDNPVISARNIPITCDTSIDNIDKDDFDAVVLPGGLPGAHNLNESSIVDEILTDFNNNEKFICAICAAPYLLGDRGILDGKSCTSYPNFKDRTGCSRYMESSVVRDGHIITSRGPATAPFFAFEIVTALKGEELSNKIKSAMLY